MKFLFIFLTVFVMVLAGCGGGSGSDEPQVTAIVKPTVGPQLRPCEAPEAPCPTK